MILGDSTVAFWTDAPTFVEDVFAEYMAGEKVTAADPAAQDESSRQRLEAFLSVLRGGIGVRSGLLEFDPTIGFHLLGLSPNAGRVSVRFFMQSTLGELLENLRAHHRAIRQTPAPAVGKYRGDPEFPALSLLLRQTGRDAKDIPPVLAGPLLESVLTRARYPSGLYSAVLRRIRADRVVNYLRVCVIAGFLNRNLILEVPVSLDIARQEPAYRLGRLFAALEKTQRDALGENLNRTICDSFYGAASMTPAIVFPRLLRLYQHHRSKLEVGRRVFRDRLVQEIVTALPEFPRNLTLPEQGSFAIGYYHQLRDFYTKREARDTGAERAES
jgi:CRISPR-associated protein Csd1